MKRLRRPPRGVTIVELLVVMAILGFLTALLIPALQAAREAGRRSACANHLRQIGVAFHSYEESHRSLPAGYVSSVKPGGAESGPGWGWAALLLNYVEENSLRGHLRFDRPIEDPSNSANRTKLIAVYLCPSDSTESIWSTFSGWGDFGPAPETKICDLPSANYVAMSGNGDLGVAGSGLFFSNSNIGFNQITDGSSHTIAVGERSRLIAQATWVGSITGALLPFGIDGSDGSYYLFEPSSAMVLGRTGVPNFPGNATSNMGMFSSQHYGGINFVFADGHVTFLSSGTDPQLFDALSTRAGGEPTF
jgi:prepilin-type processing-associated H-X9-DG protein/prepilin-type N-terminal cleavage/methylation domain-containing protein